MAAGRTEVIFGVDEAGRGPLAGPVVAAAVRLCPGGIAGLDDSKKLSAVRRQALEQQIMAHCDWAVGIASVEEIDAINIFQATMLAMTRAVDALTTTLGTIPVQVLVDGNKLPRWRYSAAAIVGGDAIHPCISAASIIAKEHRDRLMMAAHEMWPEYHFGQHKGYGTAKHIAALQLHGLCPLHRRSFAPVRQLLAL